MWPEIIYTLLRSTGKSLFYVPMFVWLYHSIEWGKLFTLLFFVQLTSHTYTTLPQYLCTFNLEVILKFCLLVIHDVLPDFRNQSFPLHAFSYLIPTQLDVLWSPLLLETHHIVFAYFKVVPCRARLYEKTAASLFMQSGVTSPSYFLKVRLF